MHRRRLRRCGGRLSQPMLELGEELFDRIEVGRVFGQEEQLGAGPADGAAHGFALMRAEIVHDDDVARSQGRRRELPRHRDGSARR